ncbi:MAG: adenylate/guanylate cyclase domain-containing protein [Anaerolineae bacterium]|jgi:adenylate cyclase|nr:adenylate/guanylate cyclase domain-containing protein [Anaerolineae bacterium]MBT7070768.1 adenylate/guanylate cyclase domain-containing protein [Anaerolineae bacterium]MBT7324733.1 adenylate/guanylate cyclase domain-containing protein [Anaerolineae bacterium]
MHSKKKTLSRQLVLLFTTIFILVALEIASLFPTVITPLERADLAARDFFMRLRGEQTPDDRIVIVAIDDFSFNWTGYQWPWPRTYLAEIVTSLNDAGAEVIGLDVFLFEEDPEGDLAFAAALAETPLSVNVIQKYTDQQGVVSLRLPQPIYRDILDGQGITPILLDDDAIARSLIVHDQFLEEDYYNWAFEVAGLYLDNSHPSDALPNSIYLNGNKVPLQNNRFLIDFRGPAESYPIYSAARVVLGDYPAEIFKDKIVLIGATSVTLQDVYPTPFSSRIRTSGVEIVATAVDSLLNQNYLHVAPIWVNIFLILLAALISRLITHIARPGLAISLMTGSLFLYAMIYYLVFLQQRLYLPFMAPETMLFLGVIMPTLEESVTQEIEKRRVRNLFMRFISPDMVTQLLETQNIDSLNKRSEITILFSDIRNFTSMSEKLTPDGVVALLNPYLDVMTTVVHQHGGTVDKYEGDAIVAFFGEPIRYEDHALRAARAALDMRLALVKLKKGWAKEGILPEHFDIGIGLNSGDVFVGLLGSEQRVNYTIIGDNANLAARLQDLSKVYAWPMIISESTHHAIKEEFETEFIEAVQVKGKKEPVNIYKLIDRK